MTTTQPPSGSDEGDHGPDRPTGRTSDLRPHTLIAAAATITTVVDPDLMVTYVNDRGVGHFGHEHADEVVGLSFLMFVPAPDHAVLAEIIRTVLAGGTYNGRLRYLARPGTPQESTSVVECACVGITWDDQQAVLITALDVTERSAADVDVMHRTWTAEVFADAPVGHLEVTLDGRVRAHNSRAAALVAVTDIVGRRLVELVAPSDRSLLWQAFSDVASTATTTATIPLRLRTPSGVAGHSIASLSLVRDLARRPAHVSVILVDDAQRQAAHAQLAEREGYAAAVLAAIPDAVLICTRQGIITEINHQTEALFGYSAEELVGQEVEVLVPPDNRGAHRWHRAGYAASDHAQPMITGPGISGMRRDGTTVPVEVNLASVELSTGPALVASIRDVSVSRQVEAELRVSHDLLAGVLAAATEQAVIATDLQGTIELFSRGAERLLGYRRTEVIGRPAAIFDDGDAVDLAETWGLDGSRPLGERIAALISAGVAATRPWVYRTKSGDRRNVLLSVTVRMSADGPAGLIIVATDQTQRLRRDAELAASEERFRMAFQNAPVGVALVSVAPPALGQLTQVNAAMSSILGYAAGELVGASLTTLAHPEDLPLVAANLHALGSAGITTALIEYRCLDAAGQDVWVEASFAVIDRDGVPDYAVSMFNDITARRQAESELTHNALHDTLTGLPNRALITEHLSAALSRARRMKTTVGVLYLDLDNFKDVNDSLGHAAGDELLTDVGHRLAGCMRDADLAGRIGGDEFVVVCEDVASIEDVTAVAVRVGQALAVQLPIAGKMVTVSASIGIAHATRQEESPEDLLRAADLAMYRAKGNGRSRYEFADPALQTHALRQLELEADLREALGVPTDAIHGHPSRFPTARRVTHRRETTLFLDYQPCFDAGSGRLVACEALLRWNHPTKGLLGPGQFLDVAEDRALMIPLGAWVLREACTQAAIWVERFGLTDAPEIWVNVSAAQIGRDQFVTRVADTLEQTGLPAAQLCLELTERQALSTTRATLDDLLALPELGVRLSIDDFGTGFAGLDYLRRLPVSSLKVDATYVAAIGQDRTGTALAATVVNLGHALDLVVVAEGVETVAQQEAVTELGADILQGFLLARPGPASAVDELLTRQRVNQPDATAP